MSRRLMLHLDRGDATACGLSLKGDGRAKLVCTKDRTSVSCRRCVRSMTNRHAARVTSALQGACIDCGEAGALTGHMGCQYPGRFSA